MHLVMRPTATRSPSSSENAPLPNPKPTNIVRDNDIDKQIGRIIGIHHDRVGKSTPNFIDKPRLRGADQWDASIAITNRDMGKLLRSPPARNAVSLSRPFCVQMPCKLLLPLCYPVFYSDDLVKGRP